MNLYKIEIAYVARAITTNLLAQNFAFIKAGAVV